MLLTLLGLFALGAVTFALSTLAAGGGAILSLPAASALIPLRAVAPVVCLASLVSSLQRVWLYGRDIEWRVLVWVLPGVIGGGLLGAWLFARLEARWLGLLLAGFLVWHVLRQYSRSGAPSFAMRDWYFLPAGLATGAISGLVGASGPLMNPFYVNAGIQRERMIGTKAVSTLLMQCAKASGYAAAGVIDARLLLYAAALAAGALLGNWLGRHWLRRLSLAGWRHWVNAALLVGAALLAWRALS